MKKRYLLLACGFALFSLATGCTNSSTTNHSHPAKTTKVHKKSAKHSRRKKTANHKKTAKKQQHEKNSQNNTAPAQTNQQNTQTQQPQKSQSQINMERGYDSAGAPIMPGTDHAPGADVYGNPDAWVQGQIDWAKQHGYTDSDDSYVDNADNSADSQYADQ